MNQVDPGSIRLRPGGLSSRALGDEVVVLDFDGSQYFTIRGCGVVLFDLLHEERAPDELVAAVVARFDVDEATARRDVDGFLDELARLGLLAT